MLLRSLDGLTLAARDYQWSQSSWVTGHLIFPRVEQRRLSCWWSIRLPALMSRYTHSFGSLLQFVPAFCFVFSWVLPLPFWMSSFNFIFLAQAHTNAEKSLPTNYCYYIVGSLILLRTPDHALKYNHVLRGTLFTLWCFTIKLLLDFISANMEVFRHTALLLIIGIHFIFFCIIS